MDETPTGAEAVYENQDELSINEPNDSNSLDTIRKAFLTRLVVASLKVEASKAGMVDLDGLKLVDLGSVELDQHDNVVGGKKLMADLRRNKPWLFGGASSSSTAIAPASQPMRQKTALQMTEPEYIAAREAITRY